MKRNRSRVFAVPVALVLLAMVFAAGCGEPASEQGKPAGKITKYGNGYRYESNGWIYLHIEGGPRERGFQHGRLVARELEDVMKMLQGVTYQENGTQWKDIRDAAPALFAGKLDPELVEEMKGIAEGAKSAGASISYEDVLGWNAYEELTGYWWPGVVSGKFPDIVEQDKEHCSAFVATGSYTTDGRVVMAHNTWDPYYEGRFFNVIVDIQPSKGHRIFMQSAPGYIASNTDFFVTDAGLMGTETTMGGMSDFDPKGVPEFIRARRAMQDADGPDKFMSIMNKGNNGGYANAWLLADRRSGEIVRFEQGLKYQGVERTKDGYFTGSNVPFDPRIRNLECDASGDFFDVRTAGGARRVRLDQLMREYKGKIDTEVAKAVLADHYDVYLNEADHPCSRTIEGRYNLEDFKYWHSRIPYRPLGAVDGKVMDSTMAGQMTFVARWGSSSGIPFDAEKFLEEHPQWDYMKGYLKDLPSEPWTVFEAGAK